MALSLCEVWSARKKKLANIVALASSARYAYVTVIRVPGLLISCAITKAAQDHLRYRVLVVDDSIVPRTAARAMLGSTPELRYVGEASSGAEALKAMENLR